MKKTLLVAGSIFLLFLSLVLFSFAGASDAGVASALSSEPDSPLLAQYGGGFGGVPAPAPQQEKSANEKAAEKLAVPRAEPEKPLPTEAQPETMRQPETGQAPAPPGQVPPVAPQLFRREPQQAGGPVSFFFDDADIFEVVQTVFGDILRVNYLIDQRVKGKVNFRTVTPIPREEVLPVMETILRINGIGFVEEKGLYRIVPLNEVSRELVYSQVGKDPGKVAIEMFTFKNMNLKESMPDIEHTIGLNVQGGTIRILPILRLNSLLAVASTKEQMDYVRKWVETLDSMFAEARPKVMVYPLQNSKAAHIASMLQSILSGGGAAAPAAPRAEPGRAATGAAPAAPQAPRPGPAAVAAGTGFLVSPETRIFADEINNTLVILATPGDYAFIEETIKKIDVVPRQVVIEGLIVRVNLSDKLNFGMQWTIQNDLRIKGLKPFQQDINISGPLKLDAPITAPTFTFTAFDAANNVKLLLQALASEGKAKVLAAPHILVSDNREARIQVGSQIPLAVSTTVTPISGITPTNTTTATIQYKDIGIILKVKPQVNDSGLVALEITQEVSSRGERVDVAGTTAESIDKTEATTNLVAQDGETIIIGGLIREDATKARSGIPLFSKIPILGYLFGSTIDENTRTELIILLTPRVMKNMQEAGEVTSDYVEKYKGVAKDKSIDQFLQERSKKGKKDGNSGPQDAPKDSP
ncbi:MAG: hypothetical protein M1508_04220 [Nitrospirae bacterium]|nr:hypothetical protein [Nitrospirota bacterium]